MLCRSLCALAAVAGLSLAPSADAHPPEFHHGYRGHVIHGDVRVYYRGCAAEPWRVYGTYCDDGQMHVTLRMLRARGYEVMFRGC